MEHQPHHPLDRPPEEVPIDGTPLEKVSAFLRIAFAEADQRSEAIGTDDAQAVATLLAPLLGSDSQMHRFAHESDANPTELHAECEQLAARTWRTPEISTWITRLEQHLAARTNLGRQDSD